MVRLAALDGTLRWTTQFWICAGVVLLATGVAFVPGRWTRPARDLWQMGLRPGLAAVEAARSGVRSALVSTRDAQELAAEVRRLNERVAELAEENHRLRGALLAAHETTRDAAEDASQALFDAGLVRARVLGSQARTFAAQRLLIDAGESDEAQDGALAVVDLGREAGLRSGGLALAGSVVWGKLHGVGRETSVVRHLTEKGYRDLVVIAAPGADPQTADTQGVWQGEGEALARITQVDARRAIAVGDRVYSTAAAGAVDARIACGEVVRVERDAGGSQWNVWARPLAALSPPSALSVVCVRPNSQRVARSESR